MFTDYNNLYTRLVTNTMKHQSDLIGQGLINRNIFPTNEAKYAARNKLKVKVALLTTVDKCEIRTQG